MGSDDNKKEGSETLKTLMVINRISTVNCIELNNNIKINNLTNGRIHISYSVSKY